MLTNVLLRTITPMAFRPVSQNQILMHAAGWLLTVACICLVPTVVEDGPTPPAGERVALSMDGSVGR